MHMKRTNLVLDGQLLDEARKAVGLKTYSDVVNLALKELVNKMKFAQIDTYAHTGIWDGDLSAMRGD